MPADKHPTGKTSLDKTYAPAAIEGRLYAAWEKAGCFKAGRKPDAVPFTIVIPPPNVTGNLHMGHALNCTLQDILCRFERMRGRDVLWQPGTDHAGIATQMVVEKHLQAQGLPTRREMGREKFLQQVWQWKAESGSAISEQLRRLGASCDWSRERFTMDEGLSAAVVKVFIELYKDGLIYRDKRLVNWDPELLTAISDLEVIQKEVQGHLWHFNYPLADASGHITIATTRPETMLGDSAVAVHPDDPRYKNLIGKDVVLPIVGRVLPIIADSYADPQQGSGAVKITPAHDFNDFEVGKRHDLPAINIFDRHAAIDLSASDREAVDAFADMPDKADWQGLDRFAAREQVIARIDAAGLLVKTEEHTHMLPCGDRSGVVIEPWLTDQWYVDAAKLAVPALAAVKNGDMQFVPENWAKTYFEWLENIQPWCISRQLWWGHQIPAWYGPDGQIFVAENEAEANAQARARYGEGKAFTLKRDEDVLDTWFSSALWPFSTLGWPEETPELERYYPTDILVTGFDIIFFWVARMMMTGLYFMKKVPFRKVYIHALVRDEQGAKMSKSKGNVVDPLALCDRYGADALRFTLAAMASMGRDIKLSESRVAGYRNFGTKLWNATRFCQMNGCFEAADKSFTPKDLQHPANQWIIGELVRTQQAITKSLEDYRFNDAADAIYQFIWHDFCDWYVEFIKPIFQDEDATHKAESQWIAGRVLQEALHLLHPFMPFVTEELWAKTGQRKTMLMLHDWPTLSDTLIDRGVDSDIGWLMQVITKIRAARAAVNVPAAAKIPLVIIGVGNDTTKRLRMFDLTLTRLARLADIKCIDADTDEARNLRQGTVRLVVDEAVFVLPLADIIDFAAEEKRLKKEIAKLEAEIKKLSGKLENKDFLDRAPEIVIDENRQKLADAQANHQKLQDALMQIESAPEAL